MLRAQTGAQIDVITRSADALRARAAVRTRTPGTDKHRLRGKGSISLRTNTLVSTLPVVHGDATCQVIL